MPAEYACEKNWAAIGEFSKGGLSEPPAAEADVCFIQESYSFKKQQFVGRMELRDGAANSLRYLIWAPQKFPT